MRIYLQVPHLGTEIDDPDTSYLGHATRSSRVQELTAHNLGITPKLLGHKLQRRINQGQFRVGSWPAGVGDGARTATRWQESRPQ